MTVLEIRKDGDDVLRKKTAPVKKVNKNIKALIQDMIETMYHADGIGLAAPQVGVSKSIIVVDIGAGVYTFINPTILRQEGEEKDIEGCLSVPEKVGKVTRPEKITVEAVSETGKKIWVDAEGLLARAILHEIDHLNGILFVDIAEEVVVDKKEETESPKKAEEKPEKGKEDSQGGSRDAKGQEEDTA